MSNGIIEHGDSRLTVTNTVDVGVREDTLLMVVSPAASLLDESGGKTVSKGLVVGELRVDVVIDLIISIVNRDHQSLFREVAYVPL